MKALIFMGLHMGHAVDTFQILGFGGFAHEHESQQHGRLLRNGCFVSMPEL